MQRSKLGVSAGLLGAAVCFSALFGGYLPALLLTAYILMVEDNQWLRHIAVKALVLLFAFGVLSTVIRLVPDLLEWISSLVILFEGSFDYGTLSSVFAIVDRTIALVKTCLFLVLGVTALNQGNVSIPVVDGIVAKYA